MSRLIEGTKKDDLQSGEMKLIEDGADKILLVNVDGVFYAVSELCTHQDGPLVDGLLEGEYIECPWHISRFNVKTGIPDSPPAVEPIKTFNVIEKGDTIFIEIV